MDAGDDRFQEVGEGLIALRTTQTTGLFEEWELISTNGTLDGRFRGRNPPRNAPRSGGLAGGLKTRKEGREEILQHRGWIQGDGKGVHATQRRLFPRANLAQMDLGRLVVNRLGDEHRSRSLVAFLAKHWVYLGLIPVFG